MNNKLERVWKEVTRDCVKTLSQHPPGDTDQNHKDTSARIASLLAEILIRDLPQ